MSVSFYCGATEQGKNFHVENHVLPNWKRKVIFDPKGDFNAKGYVIQGLTAAKAKAVLLAHARKDAYTIIIRPTRTEDRGVVFNQVVAMACALGRFLGPKAPSSERVQVVCDEADAICSPHYQSAQVQYLVNEGRHDNVDCHFIARSPQRIHPDIRLNSTKIVTFFVNGATSAPIFVEKFTRKIAEKIGKLPKYHRMEWNDTGVVCIFNEKGKIVENLSRNF